MSQAACGERAHDDSQRKVAALIREAAAWRSHRTDRERGDHVSMWPAASTNAATQRAAAGKVATERAAPAKAADVAVDIRWQFLQGVLAAKAPRQATAAAAAAAKNTAAEKAAEQRAAESKAAENKAAEKKASRKRVAELEKAVAERAAAEGAAPARAATQKAFAERPKERSRSRSRQGVHGAIAAAIGIELASDLSAVSSAKAKSQDRPPGMSMSEQLQPSAPSTCEELAGLDARGNSRPCWLKDHDYHGSSVGYPVPTSAYQVPTSTYPVPTSAFGMSMSCAYPSAVAALWCI